MLFRSLNDIADLEEVGTWQVEYQDEDFNISRVVRGVSEHYTLAKAVIKSADGHHLAEITTTLQETYHGILQFHLKEKQIAIRSPVELIDLIMEQARKGISIQRYKGLGEMNAVQLWETTLDPEARTLLQVKVSHVDEAEEVFSTLMGDVVEPRREFIQNNALKVTNLDA